MSEEYTLRAALLVNIWLSYKEGRRDHLKGLSTGFPSVDKHVPIEQEDLMIIAGLTSVGKTILATDLAQGVIANGGRVNYISLEMTAEHILFRWILKECSGLSFTALKYKKFTAEQQQVLDDFEKALNKDNPHFSVYHNERFYSEIREEIKFQNIKNGVECFFIDYLQLIEFDLDRKSVGVSTRADELCYMAADLKRMCSRYKICIVLLAQLNKNTSDLKDSTGPGQSADKIITLIKHTEAKKDPYFKNIVFSPHSVIAKISKNRNGELGWFALTLYGPNMKFGDIESSSFNKEEF